MSPTPNPDRPEGRWNLHDDDATWVLQLDADGRERGRTKAESLQAASTLGRRYLAHPEVAAVRLWQSGNRVEDLTR